VTTDFFINVSLHTESASKNSALLQLFHCGRFALGLQQCRECNARSRPTGRHVSGQRFRFRNGEPDRTSVVGPRISASVDANSVVFTFGGFTESYTACEEH